MKKDTCSECEHARWVSDDHIVCDLEIFERFGIEKADPEIVIAWAYENSWSDMNDACSDFIPE